MLRPGIEQNPFHMVLNLSQFYGKFPLQIFVRVPAQQTRRRDGSLDFMNPALDIFPILLLGGPGIRDRLNHVLARPAHQTEQRPLIDSVRFRSAFYNQLLLIQPVHNTLQLPEMPQLLKIIKNKHPRNHQHPKDPQNNHNTRLRPCNQQNDRSSQNKNPLHDHPPHPLPQKLPQFHVPSS